MVKVRCRSRLAIGSRLPLKLMLPKDTLCVWIGLPRTAEHGATNRQVAMVLPALTGRGYDHLDIREGGTASQEFLRMTFGDVDEI